MYDSLWHLIYDIFILDPEQIEWKNFSASYIIGSDITYKNRRYYVSSPGYYEVQCRLQFDTYSGEVPNNDVNIVFSIIRSTGPESNQNLMSEKATLRPRERRGIQLGPTVFRLEVGDSVYVSVMRHQYVYPTIDNYFAMRKIEWHYLKIYLCDCVMHAVGQCDWLMIAGDIYEA